MTSTAHLDFDVDLQCISGRKYILCDHLKSKYETQELIMSCPDCSYFFARCCSTNKHQQTRPCHHFRLIFTDGACKDNGKAGATAGMGIAFGQTPEQQFSLPVDDAVDLNARRSNQRAELLAALEGLRLLVHMGKVSTPHERVYNRHGTGGGVDRKAKWVITTDSEYVVKGMTDWLPNKWKVHPPFYPAVLIVHSLTRRRALFQAQWHADHSRAHTPQPRPLHEARPGDRRYRARARRPDRFLARLAQAQRHRRQTRHGRCSQRSPIYSSYARFRHLHRIMTLLQILQSTLLRDS